MGVNLMEWLSKPLLRYKQREQWRREIDAVDSDLKAGATDRTRQVLEPGRLKRANDHRKVLLNAQSPPELSPQERDSLAKLSSSLKSEMMDGIVTQVEQRRNPPGTVGKQQAWVRRNKSKVLAWKNAQILLNPDSDDPDLCNFEKHRPLGEMRALLTDAALPGYFSLSPQARENYDEVNWDDKGAGATALAEAGVQVKYTTAGKVARKPEGDIEVSSTDDVLVLKVRKD